MNDKDKETFERIIKKFDNLEANISDAFASCNFELQETKKQITKSIDKLERKIDVRFNRIEKLLDR